MGLSRDITKDDIGKYYVTRNGRVAQVVDVAPTKRIYSVHMMFSTYDYQYYTLRGEYSTALSISVLDLVEGPFDTIDEALPIAALLRD